MREPARLIQRVKVLISISIPELGLGCNGDALLPSLPLFHEMEEGGGGAWGQSKGSESSPLRNSSLNHNTEFKWGHCAKMPPRRIRRRRDFCGRPF